MGPGLFVYQPDEACLTAFQSGDLTGPDQHSAILPATRRRVKSQGCPTGVPDLLTSTRYNSFNQRVLEAATGIIRLPDTTWFKHDSDGTIENVRFNSWDSLQYSPML